MKLDAHQIYGEVSIRSTSTAKTQIFDWKWDAKKDLRNSLSACKPSENSNTKPELFLSRQRISYNKSIATLNDKKPRNPFGWAKWITPLIAGLGHFCRWICLALPSVSSPTSSYPISDQPGQRPDSPQRPTGSDPIPIGSQPSSLSYFLPSGLLNQAHVISTFVPRTLLAKGEI